MPRNCFIIEGRRSVKLISEVSLPHSSQHAINLHAQKKGPLPLLKYSLPQTLPQACRYISSRSYDMMLIIW